MRSSTSVQSTVDRVVSISEQALEKEIAFLYTQDEYFTGKTVTINGKQKTNLGSCSYLGLELHPKVKAAAQDAIAKYGTQFSSSRSYLSCGLYEEAESLLGNIFDNPNLIVTPSTSMGHLIVMPVMIGSNDLVIADHQAHYSMQFAFKVLAGQGTDVQIIRHNDMEALEKRIIENRDHYDRIWYVLDGVYSMFGDFAPLEQLETLLNTYDNLCVYADDAHGMSWTGANGQGYLLSQIDQHERMIIATSLNKSFAAGGGLILFPNSEWQHRVRMYGGHMMFSGPLQNGSVGAIIGSAKVHLSNEIQGLQDEFHKKLNYCQHLLKEYGLPVVSDDLSPIFFIGLGLPCTGYNLLNRLIKQEGYMVNMAVYPAVPENCTGLRFTINNHLEFDDIKQFVEKLAFHFPLALQEEGRTIQDIYRGFRKVNSFDWIKRRKVLSSAS